MGERHDMERYRDSYFEDCADLLKTKPSYKKHVNKFIFYLKEQGLSDRPKDIDLNVVDSCIGYYCQIKGELNTRSTMQAYLEALKSFYKNMGCQSRLNVGHFPKKKLYRY